MAYLSKPVLPRGKTIIIQGGQYGSEGKGQIAAFVAGERGVFAAVRTGSINAGHTVYYKGKKFSMQIIPTAWIHENIWLVLGAGCYIEPAILAEEVRFVSEALGYDVRTRLLIDHRCTFFGEEERQKAQDANRHHAMGATGKGASEGIILKMRERGSPAATSIIFENSDHARGYKFHNTSYFLNKHLVSGHNVLLEGTQGALLDFNLGPYPFVTTRMTNASAWLAEAGLPPKNVETILVLRSYPIRVAGNSGPMPDEIDWPTLAHSINARLEDLEKPPLIDINAIYDFESALVTTINTMWPEVARDLGSRAAKFFLWTEEERQTHRVCLSEANSEALKSLPGETILKLAFFEKTTVTKKLRRVSRFNLEDARTAIAMNAPTSIAYTFLNYDMPQLTGETNKHSVMFSSARFMEDLHQMMGVPVKYVSTERYQETVINLES